jgi:hypothetical protein
MAPVVIDEPGTAVATAEVSAGEPGETTAVTLTGANPENGETASADVADGGDAAAGEPDGHERGSSVS